MKLLINNLPSKGNCNSNRVEIDITPLKFSELLKYTSHTYNSNDLSSILWDIEHIIMSIDGWESLSSFDVSALIFMRKYISATFNDELKLSIKDNIYKLKVSDITFKSISNELLDIDTVDISGTLYLFRIPSIKEYYYACKHAESIDSSMDLGLVTLASSLIPMDSLPKSVVNDHSTYVDLLNDIRCKDDIDINNEVISRFNKAIESINNSIQIDAVLVKYLIDILMDRYNDVTVKSEGGESVVSVNKLTTDIFRFIGSNIPPIETKIGYFKKV